MSNVLTKWSSVALILITALALIFSQSFRVEPALSKVPELPVANPPALIATAAAPPNLVPAILGGKPVYVLYMTRSGDTVLPRCYPGYEPTLTVRTMGGNSNGQKEGVLTCVQSE